MDRVGGTESCYESYCEGILRVDLYAAVYSEQAYMYMRSERDCIYLFERIPLSKACCGAAFQRVLNMLYLHSP